MKRGTYVSRTGIIGKSYLPGKRAQTTLFIILGIVIVALGVLVYFLFPGIKNTFSGGEENPNDFLDTCLSERLEEVVRVLSNQGGSMSPEHYILYKSNQIEYLCYTNEYFKTCSVQQPMLKEHIESEIKNEIEEEARECFNEMKKTYENKGYKVQSGNFELSVELLPKIISVNFGNDLVLSKEDSRTYENIRFVLNNNLYELVSIVNSIIEWESTYGDAETTIYMSYYPDLKVEKKKQQEGSTIYVLTNREAGNKFQFASRSVPWPPGYS